MQNPTVIAAGRFFFYHRNWVFPVLIAALFLLVRPLPDGAVDCWLNWIGGAVIVLGLLVRLLVIAATPVARDGSGKRVDAVDLKTTGMFAACRNPLYVGNMLIATGYFLIHGNIWVVLVGVGLTFLIYQSIIANEENFLAEKFGADYDAYLQATSRWWPRLGGLRGAFTGMKIDLRKGLSVERSVIGIAALFSALALWYESGLILPPFSSRVILSAGLALVLVTQYWRSQDERKAEKR